MILLNMITFNESTHFVHIVFRFGWITNFLQFCFKDSILFINPTLLTHICYGALAIWDIIQWVFLRILYNKQKHLACIVRPCIPNLKWNVRDGIRVGTIFCVTKYSSLMPFFLRPCVRRNFPIFLFSRVSEKFGCQSLEIFRKKTEFLNSQNFRKKVWKKFGYISSKKCSEIIQKCT